MPFWMQTEDPEYMSDKPYDPEDPYEDGDDEWEDIATDDSRSYGPYYGA